MRTDIILVSAFFWGCTGGQLDGIKDQDTEASDDTDSDSDSDPDSDSGTLGPQACHIWEPVESFGWTRIYGLAIGDDTGSETQIGDGQGVSSTGEVGFAVRVSNTVNTDTYTTYYGCGTEDPGLFQAQWDGTTTRTNPIPILPDIDVNYHQWVTPVRKILPAASEAGNGGEWTYDDQVTFKDLANAQQSYEILVDGTVKDLGIGVEVTVPAGTYTNAWKIENRYVEDRTSLQSMGKGGVTRAIQTLWFVKGVGMVKEELVHDDGSDGTGTLRVRELKTVVGLAEIP